MKNRLLTTGILLLSAMAAHAATLHVDLNSGSPETPFSSWAAAATDIQTAVDAASTGDTVLIADGTYVITSSIVVNTAITVESLNGPDAVFVDGGGSNRVFILGAVDCTLNGLSITNGFHISEGGGVYCPTPFNDIYNSDRQNVTNCVFLKNEAPYGGGIRKGIAENCRFEGNRANQGAGAFNTQAIDCEFISNTGINSSPNGGGLCHGEAIRCIFTNNTSTAGVGGGMNGGTAIDCIFVDNTAFHGGGQSVGTAFDCIFTNNSASYNGGGIWSGSASNCTMIGNSAGWNGGGASESTATDCLFQENSVIGSGGTTKAGGGMYRGSARDCSFIANETPNYGGGFYSDQAITLESCTFMSNSAIRGGGAYVIDSTMLNNCVFDRNAAGASAGLHHGTANNCTFTANDSVNGDGGGMYGGTANNCIGWNNSAQSNADFSASTATNSCWTADPLFVKAANGDFHLLETSPCIDTGSNTLASALARDHDGNERIQNGTVDYGAYEFVPPILTTNTLTIISAYGSPSPAVGSADYPHGTLVTCSVDSVTSGFTNYSSTGWSLSGQEPANGTTNWFELTSTTNATLTWNWQTNYWLEASTSGNGSVNVPDGFYAKGSGQILTATPDAGWLFMGWSGDASGTNEVFVTMSEPQTVMANFSDDADGDGLTNTEEASLGSNPWKTDTDGDGFGDKLEVDNGGSPTVSDQWRIDYISANGDDFDLYPSNVVLDVAIGEILLETAGGTATLNLQLEQSDDLSNWTNAGDAVEWIQPVDAEKQYFRIRATP